MFPLQDTFLVLNPKGGGTLKLHECRWKRQVEGDEEEGRKVKTIDTMSGRECFQQVFLSLSSSLLVLWYIQEVLPALTQLSFPSIHFIPSLSVSVAAFLLSNRSSQYFEAALFGPRPNTARVLHSPVHQRQSSFADSLLLLILFCC